MTTLGRKRSFSKLYVERVIHDATPIRTSMCFDRKQTFNLIFQVTESYGNCYSLIHKFQTKKYFHITLKTLFITGTDTEVGKTYVGHILVKAIRKSGLTCIPRKPIETGCTLVNGKFIPEDATMYTHATNNEVSLDEICPYRYEPPISPERAVRLANDTVTTEDLARTCNLEVPADVLLVEGAGGFYSPLCTDGLNADLAQLLNSDVILIVKDRLGCINQALLSIEAIQTRKLNLLAIVLNQYRQHEERAMDNFADLRARLSYPVIPIPYMQDADQALLDMQHQSIEELLKISTQ